MFTAGITQQAVLGNVQSRLFALRNDLEAVRDLYNWSAAITASDLQGLGFTSSDANAILSAIADANAVAQLYATGLPPESYPQPASTYVYATSQQSVIGPQ